MLTLTKLTLRDGNVVGDGINGFGAAIQVVSGTVTLDQVFVLANQSWFRGGAIGASAGSVYVVRSRLVDNQIAINFCGQGLTGIGGALFMTANGTTTGLLSVHQTELTGNVSTCKGGAIGVDSGTTFFLVNSTVSGNQALFQGGGVYIGNMSSNVGQTKAYLRLSTVANNTVTSTLEGISGGGLGLRSSSNGVPPTIQSAHGMLVALNTGPGDHADCGVTSGAPTTPSDMQGNVVGKIGNCGSFLGTPTANPTRIGTTASPINPQIGTLTFMNTVYGFQMRGYLPQTGSPARAFQFSSPVESTCGDQRGYSRPSCALKIMDIGAIEANGTP